MEEIWPCLGWHPGLISGLYHAAKLGGAVVVPTPVYPPFFNAARDSCEAVVEYGLDLSGPLDVAGLEKALDEACALAAPTGRPAVLLWCNPHNPTGRVWRRSEMEAVAGACRARGVVVLSDEVWSGLVLDDAQTPFTSLGAVCSDADDLKFVVLTSSSKTSLEQRLQIVDSSAPFHASSSFKMHHEVKPFFEPLLHGGG